MTPKEYKSVEERHRMLTAIEQAWQKYPNDEILYLLERFMPDGLGTKEISDSQILRRINRRLNDG